MKKVLLSFGYGYLKYRYEKQEMLPEIPKPEQ